MIKRMNHKEVMETEDVLEGIAHSLDCEIQRQCDLCSEHQEEISIKDRLSFARVEVMHAMNLQYIAKIRDILDDGGKEEPDQNDFIDKMSDVIEVNSRRGLDPLLAVLEHEQLLDHRPRCITVKVFEDRHLDSRGVREPYAEVMLPYLFHRVNIEAVYWLLHGMFHEFCAMPGSFPFSKEQVYLISIEKAKTDIDVIIQANIATGDDLLREEQTDVMEKAGDDLLGWATPDDALSSISQVLMDVIKADLLGILRDGSDRIDSERLVAY